MKMSAEEVADIPPGVMTFTWTVPAEPAGEVAVIELSELTTTEVAYMLPKLTTEALVRLVPARVTVVPPAVGPAFGLTVVTEGTFW